MSNAIIGLVTSVMLLVSPEAYAADDSKQETKVEIQKNGDYESSRSSEHTAPDGTVHSYEQKTDVDVEDGRTTKTTETVTKTDPPGLMNSRKDTSKTEIIEKPRGGYTQITTNEHKDLDGTDVTIKTTTEVDVGADGKIITTAKSEKIVNPQGLMNREKTTSQTKSINGRIVERLKEVVN